MKVRIKSDIDTHFPMWYSSGHAGKEYDVISQVGELGFFVKSVKPNTFVYSQHCEVVEEDITHEVTMSGPQYGLTKDQQEAINQSLTDPNMKQIKMSIDTAREMYKDSTISTKNWLLENFTKEELEPKKGFTWEESVGSAGYFVSSKSEIIKMNDAYNDAYNKNLFRTKEQAESALAFAQLSHIVSRYNEGKVFGFPEEDRAYYYVTLYNGKDLGINSWHKKKLHLPFCDFEDAKLSMEVNRELWEQYWMIKK